MKTNKKVIAIVGPTASGKTDYAIELAREINGEIISADSRLVYKGMDIGTAKPSKDEQMKVPHHMIDIVDPEFEYSAGLYVRDAKKCIEDIFLKGKIPIIVGGTGLYFRLLLENYNMPDVAPDQELREKLKDMSWIELYDELFKLDPEAVKTVEQNDKKKLVRYIEIVKTTGKPLNLSRGLKQAEYDVEWIGLNYPRDVLYDRINKRVDLMIENGLVEETISLIKKHGRVPNIVDTIGYKEILLVIDKIVTMPEAVDKLKQNSRNYAKRQLTWFRKNPLIKWNHYPEKKKK